VPTSTTAEAMSSIEVKRSRFDCISQSPFLAPHACRQRSADDSGGTVVGFVAIL
jgi:hypothetical protein